MESQGSLPCPKEHENGTKWLQSTPHRAICLGLILISLSLLLDLILEYTKQTKSYYIIIIFQNSIKTERRPTNFKWNLYEMLN